MSKTFYITTPIYYPNGEPHLGHVYTTIATDALARFHRLNGEQTFFLTGTDEHGIKMVKTAAAQNISPGDLADRMVAVFQNFWKEIGISNDDFIRTTEPRHKTAVQEIIRRLLANDDIYLGSYEGWYDEGQEEFVTETDAKAHEYKSAISGRPLTRYSEKSYFFRLKKYVPRLLEYIEQNPDFIQPVIRRNEVLSKLKQGVEDFSISRSSLKWGIPLPNDPEHVLYVWIDALSNYITALGYASSDQTLFEKFWPASIHVIGKEILWFHTVYWPAILFSLNLPQPKKVFAHGWWTSGGKKMSKSMGNFIDLTKLRQVIGTYSLDALRYYLLRAAPFGSDLDWTDADFLKSFNELKNVVGNCLNRTIKMIDRYRAGVLPAPGDLQQIDRDILAHGEKLPSQLAAAYDRVELQQCAELPVQLARLTNGYIDSTEPFKLAKDPSQAKRLDTVLNVAARSIHKCLIGLLPILPQKAVEGLAQLKVEAAGKTLAWLYENSPAAGTKLGDAQPLFPNVVAPGTIV
ncbi:MAG TPA: methionine--tRNA ligase [Tepidisphaeraceae bacterium]|jgi:methionyl-tRNA synthetase|nr:methionine--tRNA ligase [Tepidisphaeraceae bacterium]